MGAATARIREDGQTVGQMTMSEKQQGKVRSQIRRSAIAALLAGAALFGGVEGVPMGVSPASAQNLFAPRLYINDQVITEFEVQQRIQFMKVLNAPGNLEEEAMKALVDDRLRLTEAKRLGMALEEKELVEGMEEFAGRAGLTADQLIGELAKVGISAETYRDFVRAGALWRKVIRAKYTGVVPVSDVDVDRFLEANTRPRALKALVSELVIPAEPGREAEAMALATRLSESITSEGAFAAAARQYSAAPTAAGGGRIPDWMPLSNLPGQISSELLKLGAGDVTAPISVPNAVVLFQLRGLEKDTSAEPISVTVEWADFLLPNDPAMAARIAAESDRCLDLYGQAEGLPPEQLTIRKQSLSEVPSDVAYALAKLDLNETVTIQRADGNLRLLMLCKREPVMEAEPDRNRIKEQVLNMKLEGMAENYLEELRHAALIRRP